MLCVYLQTFEAALFWKKKKKQRLTLNFVTAFSSLFLLYIFYVLYLLLCHIMISKYRLTITLKMIDCSK